MMQAAENNTPTLTADAIADQILKARILRKTSTGLESPDEMYRRVAHHVAGAENNYASASEAECVEERFLHLMSTNAFLPNSPTLRNAGTEEGALGACYVLPVGSQPHQLDDTIALAKDIYHAGAGTGFSFSGIRDPQGQGPYDAVGAVAQKIDDAAKEEDQASPRPVANMGTLRIDHPEIRSFIAIKQKAGALSHFNLSVGVTDAFMSAALAGRKIPLRYDDSDATVGEVSAHRLLDEIAQTAWLTGEPGMLFLDAIQRANPLPGLGDIVATNPCGEVPLYPFEACNLGSINLAACLQDAGQGQYIIDWNRLAEITADSVRFLDDVIDVTRWVDPRVEEVALRGRKIGLGVMGFADMLLRLRVPYSSRMATTIADEVMSFIREHARAESMKLASERGVFPAWGMSVFAADNTPMRHAACTAIAPTGTISRIAGVSPGIEPIGSMASAYPHFLGHGPITTVNPTLIRLSQDLHFDLDATLHYYAENHSLRQAPSLSEELQHLLMTATEITPEQHIGIQCAFQKHTDSAVSKTIALNPKTCARQVEAAFQLAWRVGLKGITLYRMGSRPDQPIIAA
ncbi:adenosylcobalamin-dependent ribonucleoside-diphosphate reductase [Phycisphaeraceae bacterium D3-23]